MNARLVLFLVLLRFEPGSSVTRSLEDENEPVSKFPTDIDRLTREEDKD